MVAYLEKTDGNAEFHGIIDFLTHSFHKDQGEGSAIPAEPQHTPVDPVPSTSQPPTPSTNEPLPQPSPPRQSDRQDTEIPQSHDTPLHDVNTSGSVEDSLKLKELSLLVPKLELKIGSLEKELKETKQTFGNAILTLVDRVKSLEVALKRKSKKVILSESEDEETENQGRKIHDIDGEAQEEDISPTTLEAAKTLSKVASQKASIEINTGNAPAVVQTVNITIPSPVKGQREGKAPMTTEDVQVTKRTKAQIQQEEAGLAEAMRLQAQMDEEIAKQVHLDEMVAKRVQEEEELTDQQAQRMAQVHEAAQYYTEEDWDNIRAKLEANAELVKDVLGEDMSSEDYAKRMVDMINQKKKYYAEQKAKAKRSKPMTQAHQRDYMSTFIKNQSTWKLAQLKKLTFEELKTEFEKLVKSIESFVPMGSEERVKRHGIQLEQETSKKQKIAVEDVPEEKGDEPMKKIGKRKKQIARKGIHTDKTAKDEAEEDMEAIEKGDSSSGTDIPVNPVPVDIKPPSIANWKIIKLGKKGVYQIVRENGTDKIYISFGAMLKDISRDDLTELYRLVMQRYGTNGPEDEYERVFWGDMKTMFDPPLSTDPVWNLPADIYMLTERRYPLPSHVCQAMLDKKLQGDKRDEACYQLLKLIEKQAHNKLPWNKGV
ncbi:hypothetical protein Tco_0589123 [Tanacetum coccineum]